jgi:hypothetical protein
MNRALGALVLLALISGSALAFTWWSDPYPHRTYITAVVDTCTVCNEDDPPVCITFPCIKGKLYYSSIDLVSDPNWDENALNGIIDTGSARLSTVTDELANSDVLIDYKIDDEGEFDPMGDGIATTDAEGSFYHELIWPGGDEVRCLLVRAKYEGDNVDNPPAETFVNYCKGRMLVLPLPAGSFYIENCVPIFLIFGLLVGAMYASGSDPLRAFDISTPRLPQSKPRPMVGRIGYLPGFANQRIGQMRARGALGKSLKGMHADLASTLERAAAGRKPNAKGPAELLRNYTNNKDLIDLIRKSKHLSVAQKSFLVELVYMGLDKAFAKVTGGISKDAFANFLRRGNSKEIRGINKHMEKNFANADIGEVRKELREKIGKYERELGFMNSLKRDVNKDSLLAWNIFKGISGMDTGDGSYNPGMRLQREQHDVAFNETRNFLGLKGRVGELIYTTPGTRGWIATAAGSMYVLGRMYGKGVRSVIVDGTGGIAKMVTGNPKPGTPTADKIENFVYKFGGQGKGVVGNIANGFEGMTIEIKNTLTELKARGILSAAEADRIRKSSADLYSQTLKIKNSSLSDAEKIRQLKDLHSKYLGILNDPAFKGAIAAGLSAQSAEEGAVPGKAKGMDRTEYLRKTFADAIIESITTRGMTSAEQALLAKRVYSAQARVARGGGEPALRELADAVSNSSQRTIGKVGTAKAQVERLLAAGGTEESGIAASVGARAQGLLDREKRNIEQALLAVRAARGVADQKRMENILEKALKDVNGLNEGFAKLAAPPSRDRTTQTYIDDLGQRGRASVMMLNRWLDMSLGAAKPRDIVLSKEEMAEVRSASYKQGSGARSVADGMKATVEVMHGQADRRKITGRIEKLLREGKIEEVLKVYEGARSDQWLAQDPLSGRQSAMDRFFAPGHKINQKDVLNDSDPLVGEFRRVLSDARIKDSDKAQVLTNIMIKSFPWYRKTAREDFEALIRDLSAEKRSTLVDSGPAPSSRVNFLGINLEETEKKLQRWKIVNEEILTRGLVPGTTITHDQAIRGGAWIANQEGYWIPYATRDGKVREDFERYVRPYLSEGDRIVYGTLDKGGTRIVDAPRKGFLSAIEKPIVATLYDAGADYARAKAAVYQSYFTMDLMNADYFNSLRTKNEGLTITELQNRYLANAYRLQNKQMLDEEFRADGKTEKQSRDEIARIKKQTEDDKRILQAAYGNVSVFDLFRRGEAGGTPTSWSGRSDVVDNYTRMGYGSRLERYDKTTGFGTDESFDPNMARFSRDLARASYEMAFLGILTVRSGRATSSSYGSWGYIATHAASSGPQLMEPRKDNWIKNEWSEADLITSLYNPAGWQNNIPVLKHFTYGNYLRAMSQPALFVAQHVAASTRHSVLMGGDVPSPWEPQYEKMPNYTRAGLTGVGALIKYLPTPLSPLAYAGISLNPARESWLEQTSVGRALHLSDAKQKAYEAASKIGVRNYALEGKSDLDSYRLGGPGNWMGFVDKFYTSDYSGGYPPGHIVRPFGEKRLFQGFMNSYTGKVAPGLSFGANEYVYPTIYRRETDAITNLRERASIEDAYSAFNMRTAQKIYRKLKRNK